PWCRWARMASPPACRAIRGCAATAEAMGRWRPPAQAGTALITAAGHARLKAELEDLWRVQRPEVVRALAAAAAEGDRSENAEYTWRKKQLAGIDRRVRYLSKRLQSGRSGRAVRGAQRGGARAGRTEHGPQPSRRARRGPRGGGPRERPLGAGPGGAAEAG